MIEEMNKKYDIEKLKEEKEAEINELVNKLDA
jgi:hypothetical protein